MNDAKNAKDMGPKAKEPKTKKKLLAAGIIAAACLAVIALTQLAPHAPAPEPDSSPEPTPEPLKVYVVVKEADASPSDEQLEMVAQIMESAGEENYEVIGKEWLDAYILLRAGNFDVMLGEGLTEQVEAPPGTQYSDPFHIHSTLLVTVAGREVGGFQDLEGEQVAAVYGSTAEAYAIQQQGQYQYVLKTYKDVAYTAKAIRDGICIAGIVTEKEANLSEDLVVCGEPLYEDWEVIAVNDRHEKVLEAANQYIASLNTQ